MTDQGERGGGLQASSLVWTPEGPCPVAALEPGAPLVGFDPDGYRRTTVTVARVARTQAETWHVLVGGRLLRAAPSQGLLVFDVSGRWQSRTVRDLQPGDWLPVDRRVPTPADPIALPDRDAALTAALDEDALALVDALFERDKYFLEMEKRYGRIRLFELSGYLCGVAETIGDDLVLTNADATDLTFYRAALRESFGGLDDPTLVRRLRRWLGDGLAPAAARTLPAWTWRIEHQSQAAFLRGLFDGRSTVGSDEVRVTELHAPLATGIQALLGALSIEATLQPEGDTFSLSIRNVRRFAEWVGSHVAGKSGTLRAVYAREPRYPSEGTAILPMSQVRPALARIRATHALPRRSAETVDEREATHLSTLRLLATAFHDAALRDLVNQQLYLEPVTSVGPASRDALVSLSLSAPATLVSNGVVVHCRPQRPSPLP